MSKSKIMLVTGGSRGIGAEIAKLASKDNYEIIISYANNAQAAEDVITEITSEGGKCHAVKADVSKEADVIALFEYVKNTFGQLDCLINNAGMVGKQSTVESMTLERLNQNFNVNVIGAFLCAREAIKIMGTDNNGGNILNMSSVASRLGSPFEFIDYAAAKGAIDSFTIGLAKEVADKNIRVNAVRPGLIYTELHASCGDPDRVDKLKHNIPMQRGGAPTEVAKTALWLCSDDASYITGALLDVSGGR